MAALQGQDVDAVPVCSLTSLNDTFLPKRLDLIQAIKIGRQTNAKQPAKVDNGIFESKVLSRQHAELFAQDGNV